MENTTTSMRYPSDVWFVSSLNLHAILKPSPYILFSFKAGWGESMNSLKTKAASRLICPMCSPGIYNAGCSWTIVFGARIRMQLRSINWYDRQEKVSSKINLILTVKHMGCVRNLAFFTVGNLKWARDQHSDSRLTLQICRISFHITNCVLEDFEALPESENAFSPRLKLQNRPHSEIEIRNLRLEAKLDVIAEMNSSMIFQCSGNFLRLRNQRISLISTRVQKYLKENH